MVSEICSILVASDMGVVLAGIISGLDIRADHALHLAQAHRHCQHKLLDIAFSVNLTAAGVAKTILSKLVMLAPAALCGALLLPRQHWADLKAAKQRQQDQRHVWYGAQRISIYAGRHTNRAAASVFVRHQDQGPTQRSSSASSCCTQSLLATSL